MSWGIFSFLSFQRGFPERRILAMETVEGRRVRMVGRELAEDAVAKRTLAMRLPKVERS